MKIQLDKKIILSILLILVAGTLVYLNSFKGVFVYDDERHILLNPALRTLWPLWETMLTPLNSTRPLVGITFALNYAHTGYDIFSYHLLSLIIHLGAALALFGLVRRLCLNKENAEWLHTYSTQIAATTSLLWVTHPLNVQAVTYITQRFQSMMGLFFFLTTYAAIRFFENPSKKRWIFITTLFAVCGAASKEDIVVIPFVILILDRLFYSQSFKQLWQQHRWIYAGLLLCFATIVGLGQLGYNRGFAGFGNSYMIPYHYALTQMRAITMYLSMAFLPLNPTFDYRLPVVNTINDVIPETILIFSLFAITVWLMSRRNKFSFFGVWFFFGLAVTSSFFPIADSICEYRMYVPLASLMAMMSFGVWKLVSMGKLPQGLACALFVLPISFYSYQTVNENENFSSQMKLWEVVSQKRPGNARAWNNYGITLEREGQVDKAHAMYKKAYEVDPAYIGAVHSLARLDLQKQNYQLALYYLDIAIRLSPHFSSPYMMVGKIYSIQGKYKEAEEFLRKALERDPYETESYTQLGIVLLKTNRPHEALENFQTALQYEPRNPEHYFNLGTIYALLEKPFEAKENFMRTLQINPNHGGARNNLEVIRRKHNIH